MRVLVVEDGTQRSALAAVRGLASAGWTAGVASPIKSTFAGASRHVERVHRIPHPLVDSEGFVAALAATAVEHSYDVVIPAGDEEAMVISAARDRIGAVVPYPSHDVVKRAFDKLAVDDLAGEVGLIVPEQVSADDVLAGDIGRGVAIKSRLIPDPTGAFKRRPTIVTTDPAEARRTVESITDDGGSPLVQSLVTGSLVALVAVIDRHSDLVARVQQRADAIWPLGAGISARSHTEGIDDDLWGGVSELLRKIGWWGLAELQFIDDGRNNHLIDLNGRLYGSMALALRAGVNIPHLWASVALKRPVAVADAAPGRHYQWLEADLKRTLASHERKLAATLSSARFAMGAQHTVWNARDPYPALRHIVRLAGRFGRRMTGRKS